MPLAQRRGCRGPCRRPFHGTAGPGTAAPPGAATAPASRSCTYALSAGCVTSFAGFGRRAARSACHCAVVARYSRPPLRVAALRRSSREIVDAARPSRRATSRTPWPCARQQRDLLALRKRQVSSRGRLRRPPERRWWHPARLPKPAGPNRLRHPHADRRVPARLSRRNQRPEASPVLTPGYSRAARRRRLRPQSPIRTPPTSHRNHPPPWCCDDHLNPPWLPWSEWWMTPSGRRRPMAMSRAARSSAQWF